MLSGMLLLLMMIMLIMVVVGLITPAAALEAQQRGPGGSVGLSFVAANPVGERWVRSLTTGSESKARVVPRWQPAATCA